MYPILVVDDEALNLTTLQRVLRKHYDIDTADDPRTAKNMIAAKEYAVIISDQRMPHLTGVELLTYARDVSPPSVRILLTGYSDIQDTIAAINLARVYRYFEKPWNNNELIQVLSGAVEEYEFFKVHPRP
jgi:response regulator RpfG family c-di-GMP phosphodiesterase